MAKEKQFLNLKFKIEFGKVEKFTVGDFYKELQTNSNHQLRFDKEGNFLKWIINPTKEMVLGIDEPDLSAFDLLHYELKASANDKEMVGDFPMNKRPFIPVTKFLYQLKNLIEGQPNGERKENGLNTNDGCTNIFEVDLSEIFDNRIVSVRVRWEGEHGKNEYLIKAVELNSGHPRTAGCSFFASGSDN